MKRHGTRQAETTVGRYSRQDVLRILKLHHLQLSAWERTGLFVPTETYNFAHLSQLTTLRNLRATRVPQKNIHASVSAARVAGMSNPLQQASAVRRGSGVSFRYGGTLLDPLTRQLAFDFGLSNSQEFTSLASVTGAAYRATTVQEMFLRAVRLEESDTTLAEAEEIYRGILDLKPDHAPACINLGTLHYNRRDFKSAEQLYRQATLSDPEYALAFFDLGNVLDETMRLDDAIAAYQRAVGLVPHYADAHYNLALAYERQGEGRRALRHWLIYVRLDPIGPWANHAKGQARKILGAERLSIVSRRGRPVPIAG